MHTSYTARGWLTQRGGPHTSAPQPKVRKTGTKLYLTDRADGSFRKLTAQAGSTEAEDSSQSGQRCRGPLLHEWCKEEDVLPTGRETEQLDPRMKEKEERILVSRNGNLTAKSLTAHY